MDIKSPCIERFQLYTKHRKVNSQRCIYSPSSPLGTSSRLLEAFSLPLHTTTPTTPFPPIASSLQPKISLNCNCRLVCCWLKRRPTVAVHDNSSYTLACMLLANSNPRGCMHTKNRRMQHITVQHNNTDTSYMDHGSKSHRDSTDCNLQLI